MSEFAIAFAVWLLGCACMQVLNWLFGRNSMIELPTDPENWQARLEAAISKLDEAINTGSLEPARRALEIANQLLAESVILDAKGKP
jgi:hypothetical protein